MWAVELLGAGGDLDQVATLSQPPEWSVRKCDGRYILESDDFELLSDAEAVRDYARDKLLPIINGVARHKFRRMMLDRIKVGTGIFFEGPRGERTGYIFVTDSAVISASEMATVTVDGKPMPVLAPTHPSIAEVSTALRHDPQVRAALDFLAYDDEWPVNLYRVYEIVRSDVGGTNQDLINRQWATPDQLDNFRSVHDPAVSGPQARHAVQSRQSPPNPMDEDEALAFIHGLLEEWLREKYGQLGGGTSQS